MKSTKFTNLKKNKIHLKWVITKKTRMKQNFILMPSNRSNIRLVSKPYMVYPNGQYRAILNRNFLWKLGRFQPIFYYCCTHPNTGDSDCCVWLLLCEHKCWSNCTYSVLAVASIMHALTHACKRNWNVCCSAWLKSLVMLVPEIHSLWRATAANRFLKRQRLMVATSTPMS